MNYTEARPLIKSGDIIVFSHGSWKNLAGIGSNIIRIFTTSEYSHVGIAWVVSGRVFVLEATLPKIRIFPLSLLGDFYHVPTNAPWREETEEFALSKVGTKYSVLMAIRAYFSPLPKGTVSQCAAFIREVLSRDGINLGNMSRPDSVISAALQSGMVLTFVKGNKK